MLTDQLGFDKQFILDVLPDLNRCPGVSFSYNIEGDLIVDDNSTVDWHLSKNCDSCGAAIDEKLTVNLEAESLVCPYCSSKIHDADFIDHKVEVKEKIESKNKSMFESLISLVPEGYAERHAGEENEHGIAVSWRPLKGGGTNLTTRKLVKSKHPS